VACSKHRRAIGLADGTDDAAIIYPCPAEQQEECQTDVLEYCTPRATFPPEDYEPSDDEAKENSAPTANAPGSSVQAPPQEQAAPVDVVAEAFNAVLQGESTAVAAAALAELTNVPLPTTAPQTSAAAVVDLSSTATGDIDMQDLR
jgi:hypothetical protein